MQKLLLVTIMLLLCSSCVSIRTSSLDSSAVARSIRSDVLSTGKLSFESEQAIRMYGLTTKEALESGGDFAITYKDNKIASDLKKIYVASEIALMQGLNLEKSESPKAKAYFLRAGRLALNGMLSEDCKQNINLLCDNLKLYYFRSSLAIMQLLKENKWEVSEFKNIKVGDKESYNLSIDYSKQYENPKVYDSIVASALIGTEGLANKHIRYGLGLPLTACRKRDDKVVTDSYLPRVGTCLPLTAVVRYDQNKEAINATVSFYYTFETYNVTVQNHDLPLAANFTAPFASIVEKTGLGDFDGLFNAFDSGEELLRDTGFYTVEPYDSKKIPLITVHGLFSSPATWISLHNDLMGDPLIRDRYQIWHYLYPTNLPIFQNAQTFRENLDKLEAHLKEHTANAQGLNGMVIVAHSMGGLLTRTVIAKEDSGLSSYLFESPEKIKQMDPETQKELNEILGFTRKPYLGRVIFVAVPHRGSPISESWIGWIGRSLIDLPSKVIQRTLTVRSKIKDYLRPELRSSLDDQDVTSVAGLSPKSTAIQVLSKVAIDSSVPFHSIIGNSGKDGPKEESSDGVVPYNSSHLDGAESELIVPADHSAHTNPLAVQEIIRILHLHLDKIQPAKATDSKNKK